MLVKVFVALAALLGGAGVALLALGAHRGGDGVVVAGHLTTAGQILLFHAAALLAAATARDAALLGQRMGGLALILLALGPAVFAGDLAMRELMGAPLFPMAAPTGGGAMILGWLALFLAALIA